MLPLPKTKREAMSKTVKDYIRTIVDFPHDGILFRDVTTLFADPRAQNAKEAARDVFDTLYPVAGLDPRWQFHPINSSADPHSPAAMPTRHCDSVNI